MAKQSRRRRSTQAQAVATIRESASKPARSNPFEPMERMMQAFMPFAWINPWLPAQEPTPKLDVIDRNGSVIVRAEVPGVQKSNLAVEASDVSLTIKGEMSQEASEENDRYRLHETARGVFERTVRLPGDVDSSRAKATFKDGVLEVELPKVDRSKQHHVKF
jgi:HSP20 family protein